MMTKPNVGAVPCDRPKQNKGRTHRCAPTIFGRLTDVCRQISAALPLLFISVFICVNPWPTSAQTAARYELSGSGVPGSAGSRVPSTCTITSSGYSQTYVNQTNGDHYNCSGATPTTSGTWVLNGNHSAGTGNVVGPASSTNLGLARFDGTTGKLLKNSLTTLSDAGVITFIANQRQIFAPGAQKSGFNVGSVSTDPSIPINGDIWYNTGSLQLKAQINGSTVVLGAGGSGTLNTVAKFTPDGTHVGDSRLTDDGTNIVVNSGGGSTTIGDGFSVGNAVTLKVDDAAGNVTVDTGGIGALAIANGTNIVSATAGGSAIGDSTRPFASFYLGPASNTTTRLLSAASANQVATFPDATGTVQLVGAANTGAILAVPVNNTVLATATGTVYTSPGNDGTALSIATEGNVSFPITRTGTIRNLFVRTGGTAKVNTPATTITIRKNGVDTTVTLVMTQTVNTSTSDTTHSFAVVAGDLITLSFTTTGVAGVSTSIAGVSFEID